PVPLSEVPSCFDPPRPGRLDGPGCLSRGQRRHGELLLAAAEQRPQPPAMAHPRTAPDRDRDLDRADLPSAPPPDCTRPIDPHRIRDDHDPNRHPSGLTEPVTYPCSRPFNRTLLEEWAYARPYR